MSKAKKPAKMTHAEAAREAWVVVRTVLALDREGEPLAQGIVSGHGGRAVLERTLDGLRSIEKTEEERADRAARRRTKRRK